MQQALKISFIGSGRVAVHMAMRGVEAGLQVKEVYSPRFEHAQALAQKCHAEPVHALAELGQEADVYLIAIKDDALPEINNALRLPGKIVVHTSGSSGLEVIKDVSGHTGVFYPLQTFSENRHLSWEKLPLCLEASDKETLEIIKGLAYQFSGTVLEMNSAQRRQIHLAAVFANNFTNYILGMAGETAGAGIPFGIFEPLVWETVSKAFALGAYEAQTGPARRHDQNTIEAHLKLLETNPEGTELYRLLTKLIEEKYR